MWRTFRYHMGSIAFGSLLIAVIQFIRAVMAYLQRHSKAMQEGNRLVKAMFCCVQCCLKCLQTLVEVFTRNAFIFVSSHALVDGWSGNDAWPGFSVSLSDRYEGLQLL
jgi:solute carrier family 44 (choline transporter-like protein), member 2/4/5